MSSRISDGRYHGLRLGNILDVKKDLPDRTEEIMDRIFTPLNEGEMSIYIVSILALMGAGKTELCKYLMYYAEEYYGDDLKTIFTNDMAVAYEEFTDKRVHLIVVDDAVKHQSSAKRIERSDIYAKFLEIRHLAEERTKNGGRVIILLNYQRMNMVNNTFRNETRLWIYMSPMSNYTDIAEEIDDIGSTGFAAIKSNWDDIQSGDQTKKSNSIVRVPEKDVFRGVGWLHSQYMKEYKPEWKCPKFLRSEDYFAPKVQEKSPRDIALDMLKKNVKLKRDIDIYEKYTTGTSQVSLSKEYNISTSRTSNIIASISKMLDDLEKEEISKKVS